jgi:hypothetical protein
MKPFNEDDLISLSAVPALVTSITIREATRQTVWNWVVKGVRVQPDNAEAGRLRLHAVQQYGMYKTTTAWVEEFMDAYRRITGRGNRV